jgi:hypothetical protein
MLDDTLAKLEKSVLSSKTIDSNQRDELLSLVSTLRTEVTSLARTHEDHAQSIAGFAQITAHEATRANKDDRLLKLSLDGLASSVERFEVSHPRLVTIVNSIHQMLANIGLS